MPGWLLYTLGVVIFAFGLLLSIALHEIGHMVPAKRFGVKVTQYMVGFGPTVWSRKRGDTEYGLKGVPLGGYIRMIGMVPPRQDGRPSRWPRRMATAVEDFRQVSRAEIDPADSSREFYRLTPGKKMIVMLGGPTMNLVIYLVLTLVVLTAIGQPHDDTTTTLQTVIKCVAPANATPAQVKDCTAANSPAFLAGLRPGDKIVAIDGTPIANWAASTKIIEASPHKTLAMTIDRNGTDLVLSITPVDNVKYANAAGTKTKIAGFIGVSPGDHHYYEPAALTAVPGAIGSQVRQGWDHLMSFPDKIGNLFNTVFEGKKRNINGAIGVVGVTRLSGDFARSNQLTSKDKVYTLIELLASVNLLLFFFNLLPLLPLDGGHVAGALLEAVRRGRAGLRLRANPHPVGPDGVPIDGVQTRKQIFVDTAQMLPIMYGVGSLILVVTLLTVYADIVDPVNPFSG
ncbi:site-2 protease family protein [Jatrophihabitans sp.]|uniref:M50 family metallopeptidase n=1 Tax=Jatrophihabitans sp. TaxID=1932789 RepID=UPI0030C712EC|nr:metalloprotease RseP [Jatrophihabitans sp.]